MADNHYERLTAQDLQFLMMESPSAPMDVVSTQIYSQGRLSLGDGGIDIEAYRDLVSAVLQRVPRFRQKLKWIPYADIPVWVDDPNFNIEYHVRHTALPRPGSLDQLKNLTARIMERSLDRQRPLWELWLVEGLEHQHYAIISKIHHCMLDGLGGLNLAQVLMSREPEPKLPPLRPFVPSKSPSEVSLLWDEWNRRYALPIDALRNAGELLRRSGIGRLERRFGVMRHSLSSIIRRPRNTPVNGELSAHRRVEWLEFSLESLRSARRLLVCNLNDIVISLLAGGLRRLYLARELDPSAGEFKLAVPVSLKAPADGGGQISTWIFQLPIHEADLITRVDLIAAQTAELKSEDESLAMELMVDATEWVSSGFLSLFEVSKDLCANTMMTSIAGPQEPMYSMGAEMHAVYPHVPLLPGIGLSTALMSYNGKLCWGFNGDYDLVPDLDVLCRGVVDAYHELMDALGIEDREFGASLPEPAARNRASWQKPGSARS